MLQQTQVTRVVPKWQGFMERFPTARACAESSAGDVVRMWDGLGYNRRALRLHEAAVAVVAHHGGVLPRDLAALTALPGIGPYTARAVLAFAYEDDHGVVDVNAARVLTRTAGETLRPKAVQARADALVPQGMAWAWNQAVLDLGATVCVARRPRCQACPVESACAWRATGGEDPWVPGARQSVFEGSDRQGRGRLVSALRRGPVASHELPAVMGWPNDPDRASRVAATLVTDGLAVQAANATLRLP